MSISKFARLLFFIFGCVFANSIHAQTSIEKAGSQFDSEQLQSIRNVSQSILKTRGQKRAQVFEENKQLREEVKLVKDVLEEAVVILDTPSLIIHSQLSTSASRIKRNKPNRSQQEKKSNLKIAKAKRILQERKKSMNKRNTVKASKRQTHQQYREYGKEQIKKALDNLLTELDSMEEDKGMKQREKLKKIINRLEARPELNAKHEPDPTITTMTKHYRKQ